MGLSEFFNWGANVPYEPAELPEIFPCPVTNDAFVSTDVVTIFAKILTDVLERIHGLKDNQFALMWDSCLKSSKSDGLITLLAKAMTDKKELFLVYDKVADIIREADGEEKRKIQADYDTAAKSTTGVYISFKNYDRADMIKLYSALEYYTVSSLYKQMRVSNAVQMKFTDMRGSVSLTDAAVAKTQAQIMAKALGSGRDIMLDAKDIVETAKTDLTPVEASIAFIANKMAFYLGLPAAYITGEQTTGMGTTGENDTKAVERGLKNYFFSIMKPVLEALFDVKLEYKSQDFRQITTALDALKTFALVDGEFLSAENKLKVVNRLLDFPENTKGDAPEPEPQVTAPGVAGKPVAGQVPPPGNA